METIRLGLIGDNIAASQAPRLHTLAGGLRGSTCSYDLLVPADIGLGFHALFDRCAGGGYHGINVTHRYKEPAAARVEIEDPLVQAMDAVNLVRFDPDRPWGFNTDYTGFLAAGRAKFGVRAPGIVCQVDAGGAGKATGFALAELGAEAVRLVDLDRGRARALAGSLRAAYPGLDAWRSKTWKKLSRECRASSPRPGSASLRGPGSHRAIRRHRNPVAGRVNIE